jgi:hypothetical protein
MVVPVFQARGSITGLIGRSSNVLLRFSSAMVSIVIIYSPYRISGEDVDIIIFAISEPNRLLTLSKYRDSLVAQSKD